MHLISTCLLGNKSLIEILWAVRSKDALTLAKHTHTQILIDSRWFLICVGVRNANSILFFYFHSFAINFRNLTRWSFKYVSTLDFFPIFHQKRRFIEMSQQSEKAWWRKKKKSQNGSTSAYGAMALWLEVSWLIHRKRAQDTQS